MLFVLRHVTSMCKLKEFVQNKKIFLKVSSATSTNNLEDERFTHSSKIVVELFSKVFDQVSSQDVP